MSDTTQINAAEGLFCETANGPRLLGSRCENCRFPSFPSSEFCHNPECDASDMRPAHFGPFGRLWSVTVQNYSPPPPVVADSPFAPYAVGLVDLDDDGLRVVGRLRVDDPKDAEVGDEVELILAPLGANADGEEVISWQFKKR